MKKITPVLTYQFMTPGGRYLRLREIFSWIGVSAIFVMVLLVARFYPDKIDSFSTSIIIKVCATISIVMALACMVIGLMDKKWLSVLYITQPLVALFSGIVMYEYFGWMVTVILYIVGGYVALCALASTGKYDYLEDEHGDKIQGRFLDEDRNTFRDNEFNIYKRDRYDSQKYNLS